MFEVEGKNIHNAPQYFDSNAAMVIYSASINTVFNFANRCESLDKKSQIGQIGLRLKSSGKI